MTVRRVPFSAAVLCVTAPLWVTSAFPEQVDQVKIDPLLLVTRLLGAERSHREGRAPVAH